MTLICSQTLKGAPCIKVILHRVSVQQFEAS